MTTETTTPNTSKMENRDFVVVIDKSGSMDTPDVNGKTRWDAAREQAESIARKCSKYDSDGITLYFFDGSFQKHQNVTADKVAALFANVEPGGGTSLNPVLSDIFADYNRRKKSGEMKEQLGPATALLFGL